MADRAPAGGLRERKKIRTRATLIDVAAELCLDQGYDNTTVEQIAAAADVSPRTFSRYFSTKESVIVAMTGEMDAYLAAALGGQPTDITEYEALLRAHLEVFGADSDIQMPGFRRMAVLIEIINNAASLRSSAFKLQRAVEERTTFAVIGRRMGVPASDPAVQLVADTWTVLLASAIAGLGLPGHDPLEPGILCGRLLARYELFCRTWSPWTRECPAEGQPPASAQSG